MAIYRPTKKRWPVAAACLAGGVVIGLAAGALLGGTDEPDPLEALSAARSKLVEAATVLEVVEIEYSEAVENGEVANDVEYDGAADAVARSRALYEEVAPSVRFVSSNADRLIETAYDELEAQVEAIAAEDEVAASILRLDAVLRETMSG